MGASGRNWCEQDGIGILALYPQIVIYLLLNTHHNDVIFHLSA